MRSFPLSREELLACPFLSGVDWERFVGYLDILLPEIGEGDPVLCAEEDRVKTIAVIFAVILKKGGVFLANPRWGKSEWDRVQELVAFARVYGSCPIQSSSKAFPISREPRIMVPSSGTSGTIRFCVHTLDTLSAAVKSLFLFHSEKALSSINPLPVFHVGGWMPVVRACLTGGKTHLADWKAMEEGDFPPTPGEFCAISLVPTQLSRLIRTESGLQFLHRMEAIYLGGAGVPPGLIRFIRAEKLPVLLTYGMTETAAMMAVGTRADSNSSGNVWGQTLPGVEVRFSEDQEISVQTDALFRGYYPDDRDIGEFTTGDIGRWMPDKQLQVLGRKDFMINTGGEKVSPEEVETVLADFLPGIALAVTSRKDPEWGEQVVAVLEPPVSKDTLRMVRDKLAACLAPHKIPKVFLVGRAIPRSSLGKVNRAALRVSVAGE